MTWTIHQVSRINLEKIIQPRQALWPHRSGEEHFREIQDFNARGNTFFFFAEDENSNVSGFAEVSLKDHVNGCEFSPVLFVEGIWVAKDYRQLGVGRALIKRVKQFARENNIPGLASDCLIENEASQSAHISWGFQKVERVVCYARKVSR